MKQIFDIIQIVLAVILVGAILLQNKSAGLGGIFGGGEGNVYSTRRGAEKVLFIATIVLAVLFFASALASVIVRG
ncbi:MAG: preprotein translocase subunit SecG [Candidatus Kerfeldbacteria bacterium]|nr:preprotein translocase subunit SecG [Candidatus Kerfeldbacteria bacterium]